jgi:purine-cytosine permease-like protein
MTREDDGSRGGPMHLDEPMGHAGHPEVGGDGAAIGRVENRGIDYIPEDERHSSPANLFWVWLGTQMCFGIIVAGWLPIAFGLGWWSAVSAITVGLAIGCLLFAPFSLLGPRTGTNSAVSSGAHFGLVGRMVGSLQALFIAIGFVSLTIWTGGDAIVSGLARLIGTPDNDGMRIVVYGLLGATVLAISIYGHAMVLAAQKFLVPTVGIILVVGFFAKLGDFDSGYKGGEYLLGSFWATWALAATVALSLPISYSPFANDFARYVSRKRFSNTTVMLGAGTGMFAGCWLTLVFAAYMSTMFTDVSTPFVSGLVGISPSWYVVLILLVGLFGSFAQGALGLYGTGLDTSSLIPRLARVPATLTVGALAVVIVYVGGLVLNAQDTVSAFLLILNVVCAPWMLITLLGFAYCRGRYYPYDLQLFNMGRKGGAYWYWHGVNVRAMIAFVPAVVIGLMFSATSIFTGPWANAANGVDLSFISSAVIAVVIYGAALIVSPERNHPSAEAGEVVITPHQEAAAAVTTVAAGD